MSSWEMALVNSFKPFSLCDMQIQRHYTTKRFLIHFFSVKCCKEAVLYNRVAVTGFITSWRATVLVMLTEWKNTCRSPVWSYARIGDSFSATSLAAGRASSSPEAGEAAKAVSHLTPRCVAPGGTSSAAVT